MKRKLTYYGNPILRQKAKVIEAITPEIQTLAQEMIETMLDANGVGLAAPQIGLSLQMYVYADLGTDAAGETYLKEPQVVINPTISSFSQEKDSLTEGCLSIPGVLIDVDRPYQIQIRYQNLDGDWEEKSLVGFEARVNQHEYDHLQGVLHIDYASKKKAQEIAPFLKKIQEKYAS